MKGSYLLVAALHDLLVDQLCTTQWSPNARLKEYLAYATEADLDEAKWFQESLCACDRYESELATSTC